MNFEFQLNDPLYTPTPSQIEHSEERERVLCVFYAMIADGKVSPDLFHLTAEVISLNSSSYTAWYWRRRCLGEIVDNYEKSKLLLAERDFIDDWCCKSPKNYQIWFHRRWLVETIRKVSIVSDSDLLSFELDALEDLIELEPKHYNAWSHRLFVSNLFNSFSTSSELDFTQKLIDKDVYNNSAWSYRRHALKDGFDVSTELLFTMDRIRIAFSNESPWVYATSLPGWLENETFVSFCHQSYSNNRDSVPLANTMVDIYVAHSQIQDAIDTLKRLSNIDPVREYMYSARICQLDQ